MQRACLPVGISLLHNLIIPGIYNFEITIIQEVLKISINELTIPKTIYEINSKISNRP